MDIYVQVGNTVFPTHKLSDGRVIAITSAHGYKFSDGTEYVPEDIDRGFLSAIKVERDEVAEPKALPNLAYKARIRIKENSLSILDRLSNHVDIVLVSFMVIEALRQTGGEKLREKFPKVLAYNATPETNRSPVFEKMVDVDHWAW